MVGVCDNFSGIEVVVCLPSANSVGKVISVSFYLGFILDTNLYCYLLPNRNFWVNYGSCDDDSFN